MLSLACLRYRSRLGAHVDGALEGRIAGAVATHVERCPRCRQTVQELSRARDLVRAAATVPDPNWSGFWTGVRARIATERHRPVIDPWWLPWWKPVWGHPRLATSAVLAGSLALVLAVWPARNDQLALAGPVVVQDVSAGDPRNTVMVYSGSGRDDVPIIWMFASNED
jgi:anti-sigma factor RsiW